jgi:hypothetical protein
VADYAPVTFYKIGRDPEVAETIGEYIELMYDGWTPSVPFQTPRNQISARLSDIDEAVDPIEAELDGRLSVDGLSATIEDQVTADIPDRASNIGGTLLTAFAPRISPSGDTSGAEDSGVLAQAFDDDAHVLLYPNQRYYLDEALILKAERLLNINGATLQLANGANDDVVRSENLDALTGTDSSALGASGVVRTGIIGSGIIDGNKANQTLPKTFISSGSNGQNLPQSTINVFDTTGFPSSGTITIYVGVGDNDAAANPNKISGGVRTIAYTGKTATSFTGCTGGSGRLYSSDPVVGRGYGVRMYGRSLSVGRGGRLEIRNCFADGLWTEWGTGTPSDVSVDGAMESAIGVLSLHHNSRNGWTNYGPHDSFAEAVFPFCNTRSGLCNMRGDLSIVHFHGWGAPQRYSIDTYSVLTIAQGIAEVPNTLSAIGIRVNDGDFTYNGRVYTPGGSGNTAGRVGILLRNSSDNCDINVRVADCDMAALVLSGAGLDESNIRVTADQATGPAVVRYLTRVLPLSNGINVNTFTAGSGTLNVEDASDFPTSGNVFVQTSSGTVTIAYTGKTATSLTGCTCAGAGTLAQYTFVTFVNVAAGAVMNDLGNVTQSTRLAVMVQGGSPARDWDSELVGNSLSTTIAPSATVNTFGTALSLTSRRNRYGLDPRAISVFSAAGLATETLSFQAVGTFDDGSTATQALSGTITTNGGSVSWGAKDMFNIIPPLDRHLIKLDVSVKSSIASSTATVTASVKA